MLSTKVRNLDTSHEVLQGFDVTLMKVELWNFYCFCNKEYKVVVFLGELIEYSASNSPSFKKGLKS